MFVEMKANRLMFSTSNFPMLCEAFQKEMHPK